jgi:hypothetical protein
MRMNIVRTIRTLFVVGLIAPAALLFSQVSAQPVAANSSFASPMDTISTTTNVQRTFSRIQDLAQKVRKEVGPLKFSTNGTSVTWKVHSARLRRVKNDVNQIETDVNRLATRKEGLPTWQQQLLSSTREDAHELVYQTSAAIKTLQAHRDTEALAATRYPQYVKNISKSSNQVANSIGTAFQRHGVDMD